MAAQGHEMRGIDLHRVHSRKHRRTPLSDLAARSLVLNALELHTLGRTFDTLDDSRMFQVLHDEGRYLFVYNLKSVIRCGGHI